MVGTRPGKPWGTLCPSAEHGAHTQDRDPCCCSPLGILLPYSVPPKICCRRCLFIRSVVPTRSATAALSPSLTAPLCPRGTGDSPRGWRGSGCPIPCRSQVNMCEELERELQLAPTRAADVPPRQTAHRPLRQSSGPEMLLFFFCSSKWHSHEYSVQIGHLENQGQRVQALEDTERKHGWGRSTRRRWGQELGRSSSRWLEAALGMAGGWEKD